MPRNKHLPLNNIFIPSNVPSKKLMVILHGRGDSARGFTFLPPYLNMDDMNYLLLNAPYSYYGGFSWYDLPPNQLEGITHSRAILTEIFDTLFEEEFNAHESFLFGFSQGALLTFEFGARYAKVLAGYIAVSGYIYDADTLLQEMNPNVNSSNWLCTHGTYDGILPFNTSKAQIETLQNGGFDITFKSYDKDHTIAEDELMMIKKWIKNKL
ncbi:alpha/beta hydrolase [Sulfurovum sp. TSL1]|uniref:alpha/beta hydrolase n=1 Tax=Sulfurovum sp. TSL1 TaxID=2826994 RepID=UPI001CC361E5|nr:serine esterase [Sulfurovum sp. TSL1]GIT97355.1 carboxylesterase [Sulfurovum sp. TSL1]